MLVLLVACLDDFPGCLGFTVLWLVFDCCFFSRLTDVWVVCVGVW